MMNGQKIGLLLVNHGSRSATWRQALLNLEDNVRESILADGVIQGVKTAFMEYTEPSIATRAREFDQEGFTDVIVVPIFLTVSTHSDDDIPTILGQKDNPDVIAELEKEKIERYTPSARIHIAPLLDFSNTLQSNVLARCERMSQQPGTEGLVLIGYGDEAFLKEWSALFDKVAEFVKRELGIGKHSYGWCGHLVHYNPEGTAKAIRTVLETKETALVIPVLVATDEMFQGKIIPRGIGKVEGSAERVRYNADAILPDANIEAWVVRISGEFASQIAATALA